MDLAFDRAGKRVLLISSALYVFILLLFYIPNYVFSEFYVWEGVTLDIYLVVRDISERLTVSIAPLLAASFALTFSKDLKGGLALLIKPTLPVLIYSLPYCYLFALSLGYDSIRGALISLGISAVGLIIQWAGGALLFIIMRTFAALPAYKEKLSALPPMKVIDKKEKGKLWNSALKEVAEDGNVYPLFDLSANVCRGIFAGVFANLLLKLIFEIYSTASFIIEASGNFSGADIFSALLNYVYLLAELIIIQAVLSALRNKAMSEADTQTNTKKEN